MGSDKTKDPIKGHKETGGQAVETQSVLFGLNESSAFGIKLVTRTSRC